MTSIDEFLREGRLGRIAEGQTSHEIRDLLGQPEATSDRTWPELWRYGALQLGFYRTSRDEAPFVVSIALYFRDPDEGPPDALQLSGWVPSAGCTFEEFRRHLGEIGITVVGGVTVGPNKHLVVGPGVRVTFDDDRLDSIQYTAKREPKNKQITISIPREMLDAIRAEARQRGVSASALCSSWVEHNAGQLIQSGRSPATP